MDINEILLALQGSILTYPFNEEIRVYKIEGKMFALTDDIFSYISLKNDPHKNNILCELYPYIRRGYHLNKEHWITVDLEMCSDTDFIEELIFESYKCVLAKLPKKIREKYVI